jgi:hypothetical protein
MHQSTGNGRNNISPTVMQLLLAVHMFKTTGGSEVGKVRGRRQSMAPQGRPEDVDGMVSNKCIINKPIII